MRELLKKSTPREIAALPEHDLQRAILNAMLERSRDRTAGMVNRHQPAAESINHAAVHGNLPHAEMQRLREQLERNFRRAFDALEQNRLIEPASGMNGANGFMVLTPEGIRAAEEPLDFDLVRIRARLVPEMLHPKLRGKAYSDFFNGHPTSAIQEAYKIIEIDVGKAAKLSGHGVKLMLEAFDPKNGPLSDMTENESTRRALANLFSGAMGRFRNSSTHTQRSFPDLHEAIEELMVASRLLRFLDEPCRA